MTHTKEDNGKLGIYQAVKDMRGDGFKEMIGKVLQEVLER